MMNPACNFSAVSRYFKLNTVLLLLYIFFYKLNECQPHCTLFHTQLQWSLPACQAVCRLTAPLVYYKAMGKIMKNMNKYEVHGFNTGRQALALKGAIYKFNFSRHSSDETAKGIICRLGFCSLLLRRVRPLWIYEGINRMRKICKKRNSKTWQ